MPRANRYYLPGLIWHLTHRCHNQEFLFKFKLDRDRYRRWLFEAHKRYGFCVLNYIITSNHIHLIVFDNGHPDAIEDSMQFCQGRHAQDYNNRRGRHGSFWQDRYHATAIQSGRHLRRCMTYVDMNMVRSGTVNHPAEWDSCGYKEIQSPPQRYRLLDLQQAAMLLGLDDPLQLASRQEEHIQLALQQPDNWRPDWSRTIAVGDPDFLKMVAAKLGNRARFKQIEDSNGVTILQEEPAKRCQMTRNQAV